MRSSRKFRSSVLRLGVLGFLVPLWPFAASAAPDLSVSRSLPYKDATTIMLENVVVGAERYNVEMRLDKNVLKATQVQKLNTVEIPFANIVLDGELSDWAGISPAVLDPVGDENPGANFPGADFDAIYLARDDTYLYFLMTLQDGPPAQGTLYVVEFQTFLNQLHTPGDRFVMAQAWNGNWMVVVNDRGTFSSVAIYPSDYVGIGASFLEWKALLSDLQLPPDSPHPYQPPRPVGPEGIENRFVRTYTHFVDTEPLPPPSDDNAQMIRPIVVNFYR